MLASGTSATLCITQRSPHGHTDTYTHKRKGMHARVRVACTAYRVVWRTKQRPFTYVNRLLLSTDRYKTTIQAYREPILLHKHRARSHHDFGVCSTVSFYTHPKCTCSEWKENDFLCLSFFHSRQPQRQKARRENQNQNRSKVLFRATPRFDEFTKVAVSTISET